jgi:hypothetical protein
MRKIKSLRVWYEDGTREKWEGEAGSVMVIDTVNPGPPARSVSYVTATLSIQPRMELKGGKFTGFREDRSPNFEPTLADEDAPS